LRIESYNAPCHVGFKLDKEHCCPLFAFEPSAKNTGELLALIKRVGAFRKAQAAQKRADEERRHANVRNAAKSSSD
jgi:hypothetical protein